MGGVLVLLTGDTSYHSQGLLSDVYALLSMQKGKVSFILILYDDRHLVR